MCLAGGLFGRTCRNGMLRMRAAGGFVAGGVEVGVQGIEDHHRKLVAKAVEFFFAPISVEARGTGDVFGKGVAIVAFADKDVAEEASGVNVIDAAAGLTAGISQTKEDFPIGRKFGPVVPGLRRVDLGVMTLGAMQRWLFVYQFVLRIEVKNALAGVADDRLISRADFVVSLWAEHDLASHALMIADFSDTASSELRDALVVAEQVFADAGAKLIPLTSSLGE